MTLQQKRKKREFLKKTVLLPNLKIVIEFPSPSPPFLSPLAEQFLIVAILAFLFGENSQ